MKKHTTSNSLINRNKFDNLGDLPNESTLEVNLTHEQLVEFESMGCNTVALSPTRYDEGNIKDGAGPRTNPGGSGPGRTATRPRRRACVGIRILTSV